MHARLAATVVVFASLFLGCIDLSGMCLGGPCPPPPGPCSDACSPQGSSECDGSRGAMVCQRAADGCLAPVYSECATGLLCIGTACTTTPVVWETMIVPSETWDLSGIWGNSGSDVFAVGNVIIHYDGRTWSTQASGTNADLRLNDVWGSSSADVFAVGMAGIILHYDGVEWTPQASGTSKNLSAVWGSSSRDVFVTGDGLILHYDGVAWSTLLAAPETEFVALWGDSPSMIFALGRGPYPTPGNRAYRYGGAAWEPMEREVWGFSLWGSSPVDVYAVGLGDPGAYHYEGQSWTQQYLVNRGYENSAVGGTSGSNVFVVGNWGSVLRYDGSTWQTQNSGTKEILTDVWGASATDVFIVGFKGTVLHYKP